MVILNGPYIFYHKSNCNNFGVNILWGSFPSFSRILLVNRLMLWGEIWWWSLKGPGGFGFSVFSYTMALEMFARRKNSRPSDDISAAFRDLASQRSYVRLVFLVGKSLDVYRKGMSSSLKPRSLSYSLRNWLLRILFLGSSSLLRSFLACLRSFLFTPRRRSCLVVAGLKYSRGIVLTSRVLSFSRRWVISL